MKRVLVALLLVAMMVPAFADDASVLPAGVVRAYLVGANNSFDQAYDADGKLQDADKVTVMNIGGAIELGATDQISAAIQWAPGWNVTSEVENNDLVSLEGPLDLFVGAKALILGPSGYIPNDMFRFSAATGVMIPLTKTDWTAEAENLLTDKEFSQGSGSKETLGLGWRLYFDYIFNDMFFINLYNETIFYPETETNDLTTAATQYQTAAGKASAQSIVIDPATGVKDYTVTYGYKATFEVEPQFTYPVSDTLDVKVGVPFNYTMSPEYSFEYDLIAVGALSASTGETVVEAKSLLKVSPSFSAFLKAPLPVEFKVGYSLPLLGENDYAASTLVLQAKFYAKLW